MLALYVSNVSYFLGVNVAIVPLIASGSELRALQHNKYILLVLSLRTCSVLQTVTFLFPTALTDMFFTSACMSSCKMLVLLTTTSH